MTNRIQELYELGQSMWYDNIRRRLLTNGELGGMIEAGKVYGLTSNPSIFQKAIGGSDDYDEQLIALAEEGTPAGEIFERLAVSDIQAAADLLRPLYEETQGGDGYVSIEVSPDLAYDTDATCDEARRLWGLVDRPNLMVKIPATREGIPAIERSIADGLNINITLIFSRRRYQEVMEAYLSGLEQRVSEGKPIGNSASVASFFVSRVDTKVDGWLEEIVAEEGPQAGLAASLRGKAAVANAKLAYQDFKEVFSGGRFKKLEERGARLQRPLWASTSTKNPEYSDVKYVEELIAPHTVNTVPPSTLEAFADHGEVAATIEKDLDAERQALEDLEEVGVSLDRATKELEQEGVEAFSESFFDLLDTVEARRKEALGQAG